MKSALSTIAVRKAIGLYLGDQEIAICKVASTPLGPVEISSSCEPCTPEDLPSAIERLLAQQLGRRRRAAVAVGIPASRVFFGTRLIPSGASISAESVVQKALCSSNISIEELTVDLLRGEVNKLPVAGVVACRRKYMAGIVGALSRINIRPFRSEPGPCALVRLAAHQHRAPRRSKVLLRVFLNATHGLAVVTINDLPVAWRSFPLPVGMEGLSIISAARHLRTQHQHYGIDSDLDYVMIHGRGDLHARLQQEQFASEMGTRVTWHEGPALDAQSAAFGVALGCLAQEKKAFDLSRTLKARAPIKEIFPWGELSFAAGLVACMGIVLTAHAMKLDETCVKLRAENSQHSCLASGDPAKLEKEMKAMSEKVEAARSFFDSRIHWSSYIRDVSERVPAATELTSLAGRNPLSSGGKSKSGPGSLELRGTAPLATNGGIPREVDAFLRGVQRDAMWKRDFSSIATDIKLPISGSEAQVNFAVNCLRADKPGKKPAKKK